MRNINKLVLAAIVGLSVLIGLPGARAAVYTFQAITNNGADSPGIGEAQLFVEVAAVGDQVNFHFWNTGPDVSSITQVYFDDGTLLGIALISGGSLDGTGVVDFSLDGSAQSNLPSGNTVDPPFIASVGFKAEADAPPASNGVNPGEYLDILFNLLPGKTPADTIAALDGGVDLRIGIHVQAFANGASEAFINDPPEPPEPGPSLPEPTSLALWGIGLVVVAVSRRRRR